MTTDDVFSQPSTAERVDDPDAGPAPVDFTQPGAVDAGSEWEETGGRRKMPHPETGVPTWFTRASKIGGWIAEGYTLTEWKIANAVAGVCHNPDLYALGASIPVPKREEQTKGWWMPFAEIGHQAMDRVGSSAGAHLGTAIHRFREQVDAGERTLESVPEEWRPHLEASERIKVARGQTIVHAEAMICNLQVHNGASGRLDNLRRGPDGMLIVEDLKTGKNAPAGLDEIAIQLAIYANAEWLYDFTTKQWLPMPRVRKDVAMVTWVPVDDPDGAEPIVVDIAWGWAAAITAGWVQGYRNRGKRKGDGLRLPVEALAEPESAPDWRTLLPGYVAPGGPAEDQSSPVQAAHDALDGSIDVVKSLREQVRGARDLIQLAAHVTVDGKEVAGELVTDQTAADGSPLQPLADRAAGERGCSACGRKGHRAGSPKCWGPTPAHDDANMLPDGSAETYQDQRPDAVPEPDEDHWMKGTEFEEAELAEIAKEPAFCICTSRQAGWTRVVDPETGEDSWVCGVCRLPSRAALMHAAAGRPARPAELSAFTAEEAQAALDNAKPRHAAIGPNGEQECGSYGSATDPCLPGCASGTCVANRKAEPETGPNMFSVPEPETGAFSRIEACSTLADLGAIYMELYPEGLWTPELDALANRRKAEIKGEAPALRSV